MSNFVCDISISVDGFAAGPGQTREMPFGTIEHNRLHDWMFNATAENQDEVNGITDAGAFINGTQHVWLRSWRMGPRLAGLVGRGPSVPCTRVRVRPP